MLRLLMKRNSLAGFTLIEMLVVISIIVVLAAFAGPALFSALTKGQMTASVNNSRQLYLAGQQMALDGSTNSDPTRTWPGDDATVNSLNIYCSRLVSGDYLKTGDLQKILSAPGATCTATSTTAGSPPVTTVTLGGTSALKVYPVKESDSTNTIFAVTSNYTYNSLLTATGAPYGDKGFVVQRKGGDAAVLKKNNATVTAGQETTFQSVVGKKPGEADGTVTAGDPTGTMKFP
jgi:prepilin-type N-terminal cleavage/methylation domain-containing protein